VVPDLEHHVKKMSGVVGVKLHELLTSELDGGKWPDTRSGCFYHQKNSPRGSQSPSGQSSE
jgi:hypothetical protein